jgi:hypothetical protein
MVLFDSLEKADSNGTSKHEYLCYFEVVRAKKPKKTNFFEIEKKLENIKFLYTEILVYLRK